jgi:hypothetical protein
LAAAGDLAAGFIAPPDSAKARVYWWWLNSRVSKEGITRDLEEYRAKGVGGVLLFDAGMPAGPMPSGPKFMSPEWRDLFKHALREADRLGIEVSVNLCSGWDAGGPWITPEHASKQFTQTEISVAGPRNFSAVLPQPPGDPRFYRDAAVQAFREDPSRRPAAQASVSASSYGTLAPAAVDGNEESFWLSLGAKPGDGPTRQRPEWLRFDYSQPITVKKLHLTPRVPFGPRQIEVQTSDDGRTFTTVKSFSLPNKKPIALDLPPTTARIFRILITDSYASENAQIAEVRWDDRKPDGRLPLLLIKSARESWLKWAPENSSIRRLVDEPLTPWPAGPNAAPIDPRAVVDLTAKLTPGGRLTWDVPEGDWTIVRTGYTISGVAVSCASPGGEGLEMDWLNTAAMDHHFRSMAEVLCQDAGSLLGKTLKYFHDDSWEVGLPNWTDGFLEEFRKYRGYDPRPYLPVLAGRIVGSSGISDRFLYDFRKTIADCLAENHYARFAALAHAKGVKIHCEAGGPCYPKAPPMDALRNLGRCDIPMGEFWMPPHWKENAQNQAGKAIACAAHIYGRTYVAAEAFTKIGPHYQESPADLKPIADIALCEGINRFVLHTSTSSRPDDGVPGYEYFAGTHFNRNVTWWEQSGAWLTYIARCQYLLQQGLFAADVCYYSGDNAPNFVEPKHVDPSLGPGYDYDVCNAEVLLTRMSVTNGKIVLPDGMSYRLLVLPDRKTMPVEVLKKVQQLVEAGATVVGPRPERDPGMRDYPRCDEEVRRIAAGLWGEVDGKNVTQRRVGLGRIVWGRRLREVLQADGVGPDFEHSGKDASIDFIHRTAGAAEIYFVANRNNRWERLPCTFRVAGKLPEIWDPVQGTMRDAAAYATAEGRTTLPLEFAPYGSMFVVFRRPASQPRAEGQNFVELKKTQELAGPWTVEFDPKWGGPNSIVFEKLEDWSKRTEEAVKFYSGKATYRRQFDLPEGLRQKNQPVFLDLGNVKNLAEVRLNGASLGVVWTPPFRLDITQAVKAEGNQLKILVTNLWWNRLVGDAGLPEDQRIARTHIRLDKVSPLLESGLLGPVTLMVP